MGCSDKLRNVAFGITSFLERTFESWGKAVYRWPLAVLFGSLVFLGAMGYGFTLYELDKNEEESWVPKGSQATKDKKTVDDIYGTESWELGVYLIAKNKGGDIITPDAYQEIIKFDTGLKAVKHDDETYTTICAENSSGACETGRHPLEFLVKGDGTYDTSSLSSKSTLVSKIKSGKGSVELYPPSSSKYIHVDGMFGGTTPKTVTTNSDGTNNVQEAEAISWVYYLPLDAFPYEFFIDYNDELVEFTENFNANSQYIEVYLFTSSGLDKDVNESFENDLQLILLGIILISFYTFFVMGKLNTYRSKLFVCFFGIINVFIAYTEAIALGAYFGVKGNGVVNILPFLMLGIGVDDMYILLNSLNGAPNELEPKEKIMHMMKRAGVSITITSVTNMAAFGMGTVTSITAVRVFCFYAMLGMFFDYLNQITFFLSIVVLDLKYRVEKNRGDCCGLVFCKPDSKVCCNGKFNFNEDGSVKDSFSIVLMRDYFAKYLLKTPVRITILCIFTILVFLNIWGTASVKLEFDFEWFIDDDFYVADAIDIRNEYFEESGFRVNFYSVRSDFEKTSVQKKLQELENEIEDCDKWIIPGTVDSWYSSLHD